MPFRPRTLITDIRGRQKHYWVQKLLDGRLDPIPKPLNPGPATRTFQWTYNKQSVARLDAFYRRLPLPLRTEWGKCPPRVRGHRLSWQGHYYQVNLRRMEFGMPALPFPPNTFKSHKRYLPRSQAINGLDPGPPVGVWMDGIDKVGAPFEPDEPQIIPPPEGCVPTPYPRPTPGCPDPTWFFNNSPETYYLNITSGWLRHKPDYILDPPIWPDIYEDCWYDVHGMYLLDRSVLPYLYVGFNPVGNHCVVDLDCYCGPPWLPGWWVIEIHIPPHFAWMRYAKEAFSPSLPHGMYFPFGGNDMAYFPDYLILGRDFTDLPVNP